MLEAAVNTLLLATSNPHKVDEVAASLGPLGWQICTLQDVADGRSLQKNRLKMLRILKAMLPSRRGPMPHGVGSPHSLMIQVWWSMLWGAPGVHSARWSGVDGDRATRDAANNKKLIEALQSTPQAERSARFVCVLCLAEPDGVIRHMVRGTMEGHITTNLVETTGSDTTRT